MASTGRADLQIRVRLPKDLREWIEMEAERNERSLNGEIVYRLKKSREAQNEEAPGAGTPEA
jgi:predicted HicB family RNase H-like nuclease